MTPPDFRREAHAALSGVTMRVGERTDKVTDLARRMYVAGLKRAAEIAREATKTLESSRYIIEAIEDEAIALEAGSGEP